jgi:hypothetical protein
MTPPDGVPDLVWRWTAAGQRHDAAGGLLAKGSASMAIAPVPASHGPARRRLWRRHRRFAGAERAD